MRREARLELDDLAREIELAERALRRLLDQAEGARAWRLFERVAFWKADLARARGRVNGGA